MYLTLDTLEHFLLTPSPYLLLPLPCSFAESVYIAIGHTERDTTLIGHCPGMNLKLKKCAFYLISTHVQLLIFDPRNNALLLHFFNT